MSEPTNRNRLRNAQAELEQTQPQPKVSGSPDGLGAGPGAGRTPRPAMSQSSSAPTTTLPATRPPASTTPATTPGAGTRPGGGLRPATPPENDPKASRVRPTRTRRARLRVSRVDPWSAMKTSFLFAIAGGIIFWVFTYFVWAAIGSSGLFESINTMVSSIVNSPAETDKFQIQKYISTNKVLGFAAILAFIDVILLTILGTLGSFLYNLSATMLGGLEITLAED